MNKLQIALKKKNAVAVSHVENVNTSPQKTMTLQANVLPLGFVLSEPLARALGALQDNSLYTQLVSELRSLKGANVRYSPMYPNFPQQVMNASDFELYSNALLHYWTYGEWTPEYDVLPKEFATESNKLIEIDLIDEKEFGSIFTEILSSNDSISDYDKKVVEWFLMNYGNLRFPETIPYKENVALIGAYMVENGIPLGDLVKTATDILRVAVQLSGGDVSLAENTRFKSLPRSQRRRLVEALDNVTAKLGNRQVAEDIYRFGGRWKRLAHSLHVGDFSHTAWETMNGLRNGEKANHFYSDLEKHLSNGQYAKATRLMLERPGELARRLDVLLRKVDVSNRSRVLGAFASVADKISTRVLLQLRGHFSTRNANSKFRIVLPKGQIKGARKISGQAGLPDNVVKGVIEIVDKALVDRFSELDELGNVYISPEMYNCPLPAQQRESSDGLRQMARGTRAKVNEDQSTVRFFIYWVGQDIDLSAAFLDEDFNPVGHVSYTRLKNGDMAAYHSGDIVNARKGASEFIDIDIDKARKSALNARYVSMNVYVFSGPSFSNHKVCYAGWMSRANPNSREIYDPATVENKIDITWNTRNCVPLLIDLETREVIWVDLPYDGRNYWGGNNIESNIATTRDIMEMGANLAYMKTSLGDVYRLHGLARGNIVDSVEEADVVFSWDGDVTPYDITEINSTYLS